MSETLKIMFLTNVENQPVLGDGQRSWLENSCIGVMKGDMNSRLHWKTFPIHADCQSGLRYVGYVGRDGKKSEDEVLGEGSSVKVALCHVGIRNIGFNAYYNCLAPGFDGLDTYIVPYGTVTLGGALLARGHEVEYIDFRMLKGWNEVRERIASVKPGIVACGFQTPNREFVIRLCGLAKTLDVTTVVGGPHISCVPKDMLSETEVDHVVVGEGDNALPDLCDAYEMGESPERFIHAEPLESIESIPLPYLSPLYEEVVKRKQCGFIVTSRGCPGRCRYCQPVQESIYGRKIKYRSAGNIMREIEYYVGKLGIRKFFIMDDTFTMNKKRVIEFTDLLAKIGHDIEYDISARVDLFDEELAERLASTGCNLISFGFESGSDHKLQLMDKRTTREKNIRAARIWKKTGKLMLANILVGIPEETDEDLMLDYTFLEEIDPTAFYINWMVPFPGTFYYEQLRETSQLLTDNFNDYEMHVVHERPLVKNVDYELVRKWEEKFNALRAGLK